MTVQELVGLIDTMSPTERQTATTEMEPLRQLELVSAPEPIDPVRLASGSQDIRSAPVSAHTVTRRTAHMPLSMRAPAHPGTQVRAEDTDSIPITEDMLEEIEQPMLEKIDEPMPRYVAPFVEELVPDAWGADNLLLFACCTWSVIASCTMFVVALV